MVGCKGCSSSELNGRTVEATQEAAEKAALKGPGRYVPATLSVLSLPRVNRLKWTYSDMKDILTRAKSHWDVRLRPTKLHERDQFVTTIELLRLAEESWCQDWQGY